MRQDLKRRLSRLEATDPTDPISPPEIWFCSDGMCRNDSIGETITHADLDARSASGAWLIAFVREEDCQRGQQP